MYDVIALAIRAGGVSVSLEAKNVHGVVGCRLLLRQVSNSTQRSSRWPG